MRPRMARSATVYELEADEVGVSLRNASAKVTRATRGEFGQCRQRQDQGADPWAGQGLGGYTDEPPF